MEESHIILAAKCAPVPEILANIVKAEITTVELYTNLKWLENIQNIIKICQDFPLRYVVHSPPNDYSPHIVELAQAINAKIVIFHDVFWEDEWNRIKKDFHNTNVQICVENISSSTEVVKIMRRFGFGLCLDLEHLQMQNSGIFENAFPQIISPAKHIHLTGYFHGSERWHTHLHHSPEHVLNLLNMIYSAGYQGYVVSEGKSSLQTLSEFKKLNQFFTDWRNHL